MTPKNARGIRHPVPGWRGPTMRRAAHKGTRAAKTAMGDTSMIVTPIFRNKSMPLNTRKIATPSLAAPPTIRALAVVFHTYVIRLNLRTVSLLPSCSAKPPANAASLTYACNTLAAGSRAQVEQSTTANNSTCEKLQPASCMMNTVDNVVSAAEMTAKAGKTQCRRETTKHPNTIGTVMQIVMATLFVNAQCREAETSTVDVIKAPPV
mmetsp:Transcript_124868/g.244901  ORF Transcript_124868/g.244901 Transcript_124868/m.244901 type:complete len:208 (-) Transcript_124868:444-1067(-)